MFRIEKKGFWEIGDLTKNAGFWGIWPFSKHISLGFDVHIKLWLWIKTKQGIFLMDQVWIPFHATSNDYLWHFYLLWLALLLYFSKKSLLSPKSHLRTFYSQVSSTCPFHLKFSGLPRQPVKKYPLRANLEVGPVYFNWFPIWKLCQIGLVPIQFRPAGHLGRCPWKCESET